MSDNQRVDFKDLRHRADFRAILAHYNLKPVGKGEQVKVLCPFHDDHEPSCSVNLTKRVFNCFACPAEGNVLEFVHQMENRDGQAVTIRRAGIVLAEISGIELSGGNGAQRPREARTAPRKAGTGKPTSTTPTARPKRPERQQETLEAGKAPPRNKPLGFSLKLDPSHPYLAERGVSPELVETFGLGYCDKGIMAGRVCIPIQNSDGQTVAYAGRWVGSENLPEGKGKYELPSGFHKSLELFNLHRVKHCKHIAVVEGFFGTIRLHGLRVPTVGLMGTSILDEQIALLREHCPNLRSLTVLLDGDEPGREAADKIASQLAHHWWVRIVTLPDGMQPDTADEGLLVMRR